MMYYFKAEDGRTHYSRFYTLIVKKALELNVNPKFIQTTTFFGGNYNERTHTFG
jgi:hypothetical protein